MFVGLLHSSCPSVMSFSGVFSLAVDLTSDSTRSCLLRAGAGDGHAADDARGVDGVAGGAGRGAASVRGAPDSPATSADSAQADQGVQDANYGSACGLSKGSSSLPRCSVVHSHSVLMHAGGSQVGDGASGGASVAAAAAAADMGTASMATGVFVAPIVAAPLYQPIGSSTCTLS